jgi:hypothetical protein
LLSLFDKFETERDQKEFEKKPDATKKPHINLATDSQKSSSGSNATEYLKNLMIRRRQDSSSSSQESISAQQKWVKQQQDELNQMREKYLSMNSFQIQEMKPVDLLNLTFEHNKKKALIEQVSE